MYHVVVKNTVSRELRELVIEASSIADIHEFFESETNPDDHYLVILAKPIQTIQFASEVGGLEPTDVALLKLPMGF